MMTSLGTCRLVMPRLESTWASAGPDAYVAVMACSTSARVASGSFCEVGQHAAEPLGGVGPDRGELVGVLVEHVGEVGPHDVAEDDRVGDLHHRGLEVHGEQDALLLRLRDLRGQELLQRGAAHHGGVDDLAGEDLEPVLEDGRAAVGADVLDAQRRRRVDGHRRLGVPEVAVAHRRDVRPGVGRPGTHGVRVLLRVALDRRGRAAVGVALAQHRVDRRALDAVVRRPGLALLVGRGRLRVVRQREAGVLQLLDRGLELRHGGADVGSLMMLASGVLASSPSSPRASGARSKAARMRAASEMSRVSTATPALSAYACSTGSSECVASAGASSVYV